MIKISRKRFVVVRDNKDVFCGLARNYEFKPFDEIGNAAIKTYLSEKKAISSFNASWTGEYDFESRRYLEAYPSERYKIIEVLESLTEVEV